MIPRLAFLQNIGLPETMLIIVVAILIFGRNLPQVAARAAVQAQRLRKSMADLRRETGIDAEIRAARRALHDSVPRLPDLEQAARPVDAREDQAPAAGRSTPHEAPAADLPAPRTDEPDTPQA